MNILSIFGEFLTGKAIPFIILLGILVFVHELGHFLVARWNGVKVEVFSLGFGKKLFQFKRGDTVYCVSLIPLGGYVKMFGEQPGDSIAESEKAVSFTHKTVKQRMAIVLAGPIMNLIFAVFLFGLVSFIGEEKKPAILGDVDVSSPAFQAGFRSGDRILSVDQNKIETWDQLQRALDEKRGGSVNIEVKAESETTPKVLNAKVTESPNPNPLALRKTVGSVDGFQVYSAGSTVGIVKDSVLYASGMRSGDIMRSINDRPVRFWRDIESFNGKLKDGEQVKIVFERPMNEESSEFEQMTVNVVAPSSGTLQSLGIESSNLYLAKVIENSPAQKAGLQKLDRLFSINGVTLKSWEEVLNAIKNYVPENGNVKFTVLRDGKSLDFSIAPQMTSHMTFQGKEERRFTVGIIPLIAMTTENSLVQRTTNPFTAIGHGFEKSYDMTVMTLMSFVRLVTGDISPKNVGGVISIGQAASESYKAGLNFFVQMMAIISISLFVLNLLPIPVLDGGHLLFYTIELFKGSPVSLRKMELAQQVGLALLMSLMLFALFNDVNRVFFGTY